jgi:hypothetical protein
MVTRGFVDNIYSLLKTQLYSLTVVFIKMAYFGIFVGWK